MSGTRVSLDRRLATNARISRAAGQPKMCAMFIMGSDTTATESVSTHHK